MRFTLRRLWPFRSFAWHRNLARTLRSRIAELEVERDAIAKHRDVLQGRIDEWTRRSDARVALEKVRAESRENRLVKTLNYCAAEEFDLVQRAKAHIANAERANG